MYVYIYLHFNLILIDCFWWIAWPITQVTLHSADYTPPRYQIRRGADSHHNGTQCICCFSIRGPTSQSDTYNIQDQKFQIDTPLN